MRHYLAILVTLLSCASPAMALDMPARKPGLWELTMDFVGRKIPKQVMRQCIDAASDKLMNSNFGGSTQQSCSKQDMKNSGGTITVDSVCSFGAATITSHAVVTGSFDSAYTVNVNSTRKGGLPGAPTGETHMMIAAKWLGPCAADQRPGDMVMSNGMKVNVLELQKMRPPTR
jgi:hypothetical protein